MVSPYLQSDPEIFQISTEGALRAISVKFEPQHLTKTNAGVWISSAIRCMMETESGF